VGNLTEEKSLYFQQNVRYGDSGAHRVLKLEYTAMSNDDLNGLRHYVLTTHPKDVLGVI
jgi:hypothetical protein